MKNRKRSFHSPGSGTEEQLQTKLEKQRESSRAGQVTQKRQKSHGDNGPANKRQKVSRRVAAPAGYYGRVTKKGELRGVVASRGRRGQTSAKTVVTVRPHSSLKCRHTDEESSVRQKFRKTTAHRSLGQVAKPVPGLCLQLSKTQRMAERARKKQGLYEMEVTFGGEFDLHEALINCEKNPGHENFIHIHEFSIAHLPDGYKDDLLLQAVKALANLTVRLTVRHTCRRRTKNLENAIPFYNYRGKIPMSRVGTGFVCAVYRYSRQNQQMCRCQLCRNSQRPRRLAGVVWVKTAAHVVYNQKEGHHTQCHFFYDTENRDIDLCLCVSGATTVNSHTQGDMCTMSFDIHDRKLLQLLYTLWDAYLNFREEVFKKYACHQSGQLTRSRVQTMQRYNDCQSLTIIVSHPHGAYKMVSIGQTKERTTTQGAGHVEYIYSTPTCPGSSGAPVMVLGRTAWYFDHSHVRRCSSKGLNMSSPMMDLLQSEMFPTSSNGDRRKITKDNAISIRIYE